MPYKTRRCETTKPDGEGGGEAFVGKRHSLDFEEGEGGKGDLTERETDSTRVAAADAVMKMKEPDGPLA